MLTMLETQLRTVLRHLPHTQVRDERGQTTTEYVAVAAVAVSLAAAVLIPTFETAMNGAIMDIIAAIEEII